MTPKINFEIERGLRGHAIPGPKVFFDPNNDFTIMKKLVKSVPIR
jgi:hypothetical protein